MRSLRKGSGYLLWGAKHWRSESEKGKGGRQGSQQAMRCKGAALDTASRGAANARAALEACPLSPRDSCRQNAFSGTLVRVPSLLGVTWPLRSPSGHKAPWHPLYPNSGLEGNLK